MTNQRIRRGGLGAMLAVAALLAAFVLPATVAAQVDCSDVSTDPTAAQYCPDPSTGVGTSGGDEVAATGGGGELPFTGLDVFSLLAVAVALTGAGLVIRRLATSGGRTH